MDIIWSNGEISASKIAEVLNQSIGYSKTTTYTLIKRCIDKGAIERQDPNFICRPLITKQEVQEMETKELANKLFGGSTDLLVASLLGKEELSQDEILRLRNIVKNWGI